VYSVVHSGVGMIIAVAGKGGVGKTTVSALLTLRLVARGVKPVLAVDADPNCCLDTALGVKVGSTVGGVRETARQIAGTGMAVGVAKQDLLELKIAESIVESKDFDLIAMGRPEGPGCYCYANNVLKASLEKLASKYPAVVLDNEAGLENLSRRIAPVVDVLVLVTDPSKVGLDTAKRLHALSKEMGITYGKLVLVVNRARNGELSEAAKETAAAIGVFTVLALPDDAEVADLAEKGRDLRGLDVSNPVAARIDELIKEIQS
jgi:CO dehydrogenase maturation factor